MYFIEKENDLVLWLKSIMKVVLFRFLRKDYMIIMFNFVFSIKYSWYIVNVILMSNDEYDLCLCY